MRNLLLGLVLLLTGCQTAPNATLLGGTRDFQDSSEWEGTDKQTNVLGVRLDVAGKDGFGPEVGFTQSEDVCQDDRYVNRRVNDTKTTVEEVYFGLRKNWMVTDQWQVSCSGGFSSLNVETTIEFSYDGHSGGDRGQAYAPYVNVGTSWFITNDLFVGIEYRHHFLNEDVDIFILDPEIDCDMYLLTLGWAF